jgi:hypothetical protein
VDIVVIEAEDSVDPSPFILCSVIVVESIDSNVDEVVDGVIEMGIVSFLWQQDNSFSVHWAFSGLTPSIIEISKDLMVKLLVLHIVWGTQLKSSNSEHWCGETCGISG